MTIIIAFHQNHYRNFKHFYLNHVCIYWRQAFSVLHSLPTFRGVDALDLNPPVSLFKTLFRSVYGY